MEGIGATIFSLEGTACTRWGENAKQPRSARHTKPPPPPPGLVSAGSVCPRRSGTKLRLKSAISFFRPRRVSCVSVLMLLRDERVAAAVLGSQSRASTSPSLSHAAAPYPTGPRHPQPGRGGRGSVVRMFPSSAACPLPLESVPCPAPPPPGPGGVPRSPSRAAGTGPVEDSAAAAAAISRKSKGGAKAVRPRGVGIGWVGMGMGGTTAMGIGWSIHDRPSLCRLLARKKGNAGG